MCFACITKSPDALHGLTKLLSYPTHKLVLIGKRYRVTDVRVLLSAPRADICAPGARGASGETRGARARYEANTDFVEWETMCRVFYVACTSLWIFHLLTN